MSVEIIRNFFGWCALINIGLLMGWLLFFCLGHDFMYRMHGKLFKLSIETFDAFHYGGMAMFKLGIFLFNLVPYFALRIIG